MLSEEHQRMMLAYVSGLIHDSRIRSVDDIAILSAKELLALAEKVDDAALGLFVQLLKCTKQGQTLFEKLMGDHEEENRPMVDAFFSRYLNSVMSGVEKTEEHNSLEMYLPQHSFDDLAFVQSRHAFFLRQSIETINDYLDGLFLCKHEFVSGEQEAAWAYFWNKVMSK